MPLGNPLEVRRLVSTLLPLYTHPPHYPLSLTELEKSTLIFHEFNLPVWLLYPTVRPVDRCLSRHRLDPADTFLGICLPPEAAGFARIGTVALIRLIGGFLGVVMVGDRKSVV